MRRARVDGHGEAKQTPLHLAAVKEAREWLVASRKYPTDYIDAVYNEFVAEQVEYQARKQSSRKTWWSHRPENLFALPFAVVGGGLKLAQLRAMPYWPVSSSQVSILLRTCCVSSPRGSKRAGFRSGTLRG